MSTGIHITLESECIKWAMTLASFIDPRQSNGPYRVIPPEILENAKGIAILTVARAGFLGPTRYGNGTVVARLADGSWSAPSAIGVGAAGFGAQTGLEMTDIVLVLNDQTAVQILSQAGSGALGGNVSVTAGPVGQNAAAGEGLSLKGFTGIFGYSAVKGLFAGVDMELSEIFDRSDTNKMYYGQQHTAGKLLRGAIKPPPEARPLMDVLNSQGLMGAHAATCILGKPL